MAQQPHTTLIPRYDESLVQQALVNIDQHFKDIDYKPAFHEWLQSTADYVQVIRSSQPTSPVLFIMGNEASDLDSCVSSLSYAYLLHLATKSPFYANLLPPQVRVASETLRVIPILNVSPDELCYRSLVSRLLHLTLPSLNGMLTFAPDLPLAAWSKNDQVWFGLVDHNDPAPSQGWLYRANVVSIIDHHADKHHFMHASPRVVMQAGSATSVMCTTSHMKWTIGLTEQPCVDIVTKYGFTATDSTARSSFAVALLRYALPIRLSSAVFPSLLPGVCDVSVCLSLGDLVCSAIAVDTIGMDPVAHKRTEVDEAALCLLGQSHWVTPTETADLVSIKEVFPLLSALLSDTSSLTTTQCLSMDLKEVVVRGRHQAVVTYHHRV